MITPASIADVLLIQPKRFGDARGYFAETFNPRMAAAAKLPIFVQDNESLSVETGTVRGLHYQVAPFSQTKLVRCVRGAVLDVAVDLRTQSSTYGQYVAQNLSAESGLMVLVPSGFAHGFCTLQPDTLVCYKVDAVYSAPHERGLAWDDPDLGISWPVPVSGAVLSDKDRANPPLASLPRGV